LALQCGGSDGYSGITANPALGVAVDELVRHGGTAILAETPEIYGAEHLLTRRAATQEVGEKLVDIIKWTGGEEAFSGETNSEKDKRIEHSKSQDVIWFYGTLLAAPLFVLLMGLAYVGRRRRRFAKRPAKRVAAAEEDKS
jgi:hypothetical protein